MLDRQEVRRQNALQASDVADRAGAIVEDQIEAIMEQAEASAEAVRRNAERDADVLRQEAAASALRVLERIEALSGSMNELVGDLKREVDDLSRGAGDQRET